MKAIIVAVFITISFGLFAQDSTTLYYETGELLGKGILEKGKVVGHWVFYYESGKKYSEGAYLDFYMNGLWSYYYENGNLKSQEMSNKGVVSWQKFYHENGQLESFGATVMLSTKSFWWSVGGGKRGKGKVRSYNALDIVKDGEWVYYDDKGQLLKKEWYARGELQKSR